MGVALVNGVKDGSREMSFGRETSYATAHTEDNISCGRSAMDMVVWLMVVWLFLLWKGQSVEGRMWFSIEWSGRKDKRMLDGGGDGG